MRGSITNKKSKQRETAVSKAYLAHQTALRSFVSKMVSSPADVDDVTQEAFLRAFNAEKAKEIEQPKSFLFTIARNIVLSNITRKSSKLTDHVADFDLLGGFTEDDVVFGETLAQETFGLYCRAVGSLPPQARQVFLLRKVYGLSHKGIGQRLSIAVSTVEKHLAKGVKACAVYLREHGR